MNQSCQNCKKDFVIDERDQNFYKKINVPHPTWCPECRFIRRFSFKNAWSIYWRNCEKCNIRTLSMFPAESELHIICTKCWWADDWDGTEYAMEYDPSRNFFEQYQELTKRTPWVATDTIGSSMVNSDYCNAASWLRNCYLTFYADYCENVAHSSILFQLKDSSDCLRMKDSELCYESIGQNKGYRVFFSEECDACTDVWFSRNCYNCNNCIGCANLRGASYQIFNFQYSKEEYVEKIKELNLGAWLSLQKLKQDAHVFWLTQPYREYTGNSLNLNVTGEYVFESKNSDNLYLCTSVEDSRYIQMVSVPAVKDCYDYSGWGAGAELMYEAVGSGEKVNSVRFSGYCYPDTFNIEYSLWASACKNCFGCNNLKRKQYCILNKEYTKEEYEKLRTQIIEDMKKNPYTDELGRTWSYGEFFPLFLNPFAYNQSNISRFIAKTKDEALREGYKWYDAKPTEYTISLSEEKIPDTASEEILKEILGCKECKRGYKIGELEFALLKKLELPLPHSCPTCRQNARFARLNPPKLWKRHCAHCAKEITTAFAPQRAETVLCVLCYQQEFV